MIQRVSGSEISLAAELACCLWPDNSPGDMERELRLLFEKGAAFFLAWEEEKAVGFAQCQLRHDYVEGTENSPVGYLEGIYVMEACRKQGIAKKLLVACEEWAKTIGCREFASDCELGNDESLRFHLRTGFEEANRIICFVKRI